MLHKYCAVYENVKLRPLCYEDIEQLRIWRNDKKKTSFLRPIEYISEEMQIKWFSSYLKDQNQIIFAIEETADLHRMVGSVALYDFNDTVAEIGKIQIGDDEAHGKGIGRKALLMASKIGFVKLGLNKIIASVHQKNIPSHFNFDKLGFEIYGSHDSVVGGLEDELQITSEKLVALNPNVKEIILNS